MIQKHSIPNSDAVIYAETANLNYFLKTELAPDANDGVINKQSEVKAHSRRRYVGDNEPTSVPKTNRVFLYDPGRRNGNATPGKEMILDDGTERRVFTFTGPWVDVHAFLVGDAKMDLKAYSPSARYDIVAAEEQVQAQAIKAR